MDVKRFEFNSIFNELSDGSLELKKPIEVVKTIYPVGTKFQKGVIYGGVDFHLYKNRGIAVEDQENSEGPLKVVGFFAE